MVPNCLLGKKTGHVFKTEIYFKIKFGEDFKLIGQCTPDTTRYMYLIFII